MSRRERNHKPVKQISSEIEPLAEKDTRVPVWEGIVKGAKVTIYDMEAYEESKRLYPDDNEKPPAKTNRVTLLPAKRKTQARYDWITPLPSSDILPSCAPDRENLRA